MQPWVAPTSIASPRSDHSGGTIEDGLYRLIKVEVARPLRPEVSNDGHDQITRSTTLMTPMSDDLQVDVVCGIYGLKSVEYTAEPAELTLFIPNDASAFAYQKM